MAPKCAACPDDPGRLRPDPGSFVEMHVVSVQVGSARSLQVSGRAIETGINKTGLTDRPRRRRGHRRARADYGARLDSHAERGQPQEGNNNPA